MHTWASWVSTTCRSRTALQRPCRSLLWESQETLASFLFNPSWFKLSLYSNRTPFLGVISLPKVRKRYSPHVNMASIYGMKSMSYTLFASFFTSAKWEVAFNFFLSLWKGQLSSQHDAPWRRKRCEQPLHCVAQCSFMNANEYWTFLKSSLTYWEKYSTSTGFQVWLFPDSVANILQGSVTIWVTQAKDLGNWT